MLKLSSNYDIDQRHQLKLVVARQYNNRQEFDLHGRSRNERPELHLKLRTLTGELLWQSEWNNSWSSSIGFSGMQQRNTYSGRQLIPNYLRWQGGLFGTVQWQHPKRPLLLEAGARFDHILQDVYRRLRSEVVNDEQQFGSITSSIGGVYSPTEQFSLRANVATAWRPPNISELYSDGVHHGSASYEIGDISLSSEQSRHASLGLNFTGKRLSVNAEVYVNHIEKFIYLAPQLPPTLTIRGAFPTFAYRQTDALLRGAMQN